MATIFHIAGAADWSAAQKTGEYTVSTLGRTLAEEGFIHASRGDQWPAVRDRFYSGVDEPLVLLRIDTDRLDVPVVDEADPGTGETFPHIYGPLPVSAVAAAIPLHRGSAPPRSSDPGFAAIYFREMFQNAALVLLVLALGFGGILLGSATGSDSAPGLLGLAGTALGIALAVWIHRRRRSAG